MNHKAGQLRVAFVTTNFPPLQGGIARLCWEVSHRLARQGWDVTLIAPQWAQRGEHPWPTGAGAIRTRGQRPLEDLKMALQLRRLNPVDVVVCCRWYPEGLIAVVAGTRAPIAVWAHGAELYDRVGRAAWSVKEHVRRRLRRLVFRRADLVLADSRFTQGLVREFAPSARRIRVIPLGTDPDFFRPEPRAGEVKQQLGLQGRRVVLSVSRLVPHKGHETIMRAIPLIMHAHGALKYVIVGDGPHRPALEALARHMGIESLVHFAGEVPDRELARWYAAADVFALCSEERRGERSVEGFGIVFLEASASGLPVVGTKAGGIPDAVADGETGLLVPPGDPDAVAHAIGRLLQDNELALRMGSAGRDRVLNQFNWGNTAIALSRELQSLLPGSSLRPQAR